MYVKINFELEENAPKNYFSAGIGWYLHGKLEDMAGFDIVSCSINPRELKEGTYRVTYNNNINAFLFCWQIYYGSHITYRGLIVKEDDFEYVLDAHEKYKNRKKTL